MFHTRTVTKLQETLIGATVGVPWQVEKIEKPIESRTSHLRTGQYELLRNSSLFVMIFRGPHRAMGQFSLVPQNPLDLWIKIGDFSGLVQKHLLAVVEGKVLHHDRQHPSAVGSVSNSVAF